MFADIKKLVEFLFQCAAAEQNVKLVRSGRERDKSGSIDIDIIQYIDRTGFWHNFSPWKSETLRSNAIYKHESNWFATVFPIKFEVAGNSGSGSIAIGCSTHEAQWEAWFYRFKRTVFFIFYVLWFVLVYCANETECNWQHNNSVYYWFGCIYFFSDLWIFRRFMCPRYSWRAKLRWFSVRKKKKNEPHTIFIFVFLCSLYVSFLRRWICHFALFFLSFFHASMVWMCLPFK